MSYQTVCDLCARVINDRDPPLWHLDFERTDAWDDLSSEINFCQHCVKDVLFPKIQKYMEEFHSKMTGEAEMKTAEGK